jgi:calcium-dependent protein kinase
MGLCSSSTAARAASDPGAAATGDAAAAKKGRGIVACGKRTDFGYDKDFEARYSLGKLLGHGQFGYTFAAVDRASSERVAVKRIDKNKVLLCVLRAPATEPSLFFFSFPFRGNERLMSLAG